ncbi:hypothetical protein BN2475_40141 [Paraburkholderia ribeironis]|uniref:Uncharacterized protein n=1 Tax=Paraburkholderia ribeironis TaxID=1247936 RepID=A0A1N7RJS0_9BURK|nr:hypothetical protein BN2475_40141 [Paraburkholderia ribeironis]
MSLYDRCDNHTERDMPVIALRRSRQPGRQRPRLCQVDYFAHEAGSFSRVSGHAAGRRHGARR